jgi:DNA-binding MarR family transcriptional regulator
MLFYKNGEALVMITYNNDIAYFSDGDADYELWNLFTVARYTTFRAREIDLQRYGLTPENARMLFVIQALQDKATPTEISRAILHRPHTVSAMISRMEKLGLVQTTKYPGHKNWILVKLTEKGTQAYELTAKRGPIHRIMSSLDEAQCTQFRDILDVILKKARFELGLDRDKFPLSD